MFPAKKISLRGVWPAVPIAAIFLLVLSLPVSAAEATGTQEGFRASQIIDRTVVNDRGQEVGEVDDLIMNRRGKIQKVVLSVGTFLGIGDQRVAVSFKALQINSQGDIIYNVTREQLEKHPIFSYRAEGFKDYYFWPPPPAGGFELVPPGYQGHFPYEPLPGSSPRGRYRGNYGPWGWEYSPERLRVNAILNRNLWNEKGQQVGEIDDLLIGRDAKVKTIILGTGGILGIDEKRVALPFEPFKVSGSGLVYDVSERKLKELPAYH